MNPKVPDDCPLHEQHAWQQAKALYGFLIASVIFTVLVYALLWQIHDNAVASCERGNTIRVEVNKAHGAVDKIIDVLVAARLNGPSGYPPDQVNRLLAAAEDLHPIPLADCEEVNPKPWPL